MSYLNSKFSSFLIAVVVVVFSSCKEQNNLQAFEGTGYWEAENLVYAPEDQAYYKLWFCRDSFRINSRFITDIGRDSNGCIIADYTEFMSGIVQRNESVLTLTGTYTDSTYVSPNEGCYNVGTFNFNYSMEYKANQIVLDRDAGRHKTIPMRKESQDGCW